MEHALRSGFLFVAVFAALTLYSPHAQAATHIYLIRGFANIFSTGLDTLAGELAARGYKAEVHNHIEVGSLAVEAAKRQKTHKGAVIIIGHSLGADAAISMAETMKQEHAKVLLLVTFGPSDKYKVPSNVAHAINYYHGESTLSKGRGFTGTIDNVNLNKKNGINHFNVEKIERLHAQVIAKIRALSRAR